MVQKLLKEGFSVVWYDPPPMAAKSDAPPEARRIDTLEAAIYDADACFISYPSNEFDSLPSLLEGRKRSFIVVDPDRRYRGLAGHSQVRYVPFGIGESTRS